MSIVFISFQNSARLATECFDISKRPAEISRRSAVKAAKANSLTQPGHG